MGSGTSSFRTISLVAASVALAVASGWFIRNLLLQESMWFWQRVWALELTGVFIAGLLWFAARQISAGREHAELSSRAYALLASSVVWAPLVTIFLWYLGVKFTSEAPEPVHAVCFFVVVGIAPIVHFTAVVQILRTRRSSRGVFALLNALMFLFDIFVFGVGTDLLQLGLG